MNNKTINKIEEYLKNPKTKFQTPYGVINFRPELIRSILLDIKHAVYSDFDNLQITQGNEGSGKSSFIFQLAFVYHFFLKKFGLINYDFNLDLVYFSLDKILNDMTNYADIPYKIYILDEADE